MASAAVIRKARELSESGAVREVRGNFDAWIVRGETGTYGVFVWRSSDGSIRKVECTCKAGQTEQECYHALAVLAEY